MKHIKWDDIPFEYVNDQFARKIAWDGKIMIARTDVARGYVVPPHSHHNEQMTFVVSGVWRFQLEGRTVDVGPNEITVTWPSPPGAMTVYWRASL